jgi:guanine deaminase
MPQTIRGRLLIPRADVPRFDLIEDGIVTYSEGQPIEFVGPAPRDCPLPETRPGAVWLPSFVDTHVHCPQTRIRGSASGPLLDWLKTSVFPEEARLADPEYARFVASVFCTQLVQQGTTCAAVYSTSNAQATDILFDTMASWDLAGHVGLTLMDQGAPDALCVPAKQALADAERLIQKWHGHRDRLFFAITPRFALSCSPELMRGAAALAEKYDLLMQTHISENPAEIAAVGDMFPERRDYLDVYDHHGLLGRHALFAHCIHLSDDAWDRLATADAAVSHCPDSNFFLGSGCMPIAQPIARGVRMGLGTDVGAGRTFSLRRIAASAYDASLITGHPLSSEALLWYATRGGGDALRLPFGRLEAGAPADLVALETFTDATGTALFDELVHDRDAGQAVMTIADGAVRHQKH